MTRRRRVFADVPRTGPSIPNKSFPTIAVEVGSSETYPATVVCNCDGTVQPAASAWL